MDARIKFKNKPQAPLRRTSVKLRRPVLPSLPHAPRHNSCPGPKCVYVHVDQLIFLQYSQKTASQWIQEYTLSDIIWYLKNTSLSLKEISNKLGFPNTSFFGKYFRQHFNCTPMDYRLSNQQK